MSQILSNEFGSKYYFTRYYNYDHNSVKADDGQTDIDKDSTVTSILSETNNHAKVRQLYMIKKQ